MVLKRARYFILCSGKSISPLPTDNPAVIAGAVSDRGFSQRELAPPEQLSLFAPHQGGWCEMPDRSNLVYRYDGTYQGFLCCVAQCFTDKGLPQAVQRWEEPQATLFPLQGVDTDLDLAQRVERSIRAKASPEALRWVRDGFLSCEAQKELLLIRFVLLGYKYGAKVTGLTVQPDVCALWKTVRTVRNEAHCYLEFLRFSDLGGFLVGELAPKNTVLPLIAGHFCDRLPEEDFVLYDRTHAMGFFHRQ